MLAAAVNGLYGYLDWIARMAVPFTAAGEFLAGWGAFKGLTYKGATQAALTVTYVAAGPATIDSGQAIGRGDSAQFVTTATVSVEAAGNLVVPVQAVLAGAAGNTPPGAIMTLASPVSGVNSSGVAGAATTVGADVETDDNFRARVLTAFAQPPQGGALADYESWALAAAGVTRAWVQPLANGAGTVTVYIMMDAAESAFGGFPQGADGVATAETRAAAATGDQLTVANAIYPLRPVTALVTVAAPAANPIAMTINGAAGWSSDTLAAVEAAIDTMLLALGSPGGVSLPNDAAAGVTNLSAIETAIASVAGTAGFVITAVSCPHGTATPGGDGNVTSNTGYLATCGTITRT